MVSSVSYPVPLGLLNLGASLGRLKGSKDTVPVLLSLITIAKLIVIPAVSLPVIYFITLALPDLAKNKILLFVIMFQACVPTASSVVFMSQHHSPSGAINGVLAKLMLAQYLGAIFTLTVNVVVILWLLQ